MLVKVLLRQVRVIFQTWRRFVWSWTGVSRLGNGALRSARLSPQRAAAPPGAPDLSAPCLPPELHGTPNHAANTPLLLPFGIFSYVAPIAHEVKDETSTFSVFLVSEMLARSLNRYLIFCVVGIVYTAVTEKHAPRSWHSTSELHQAGL